MGIFLNPGNSGFAEIVKDKYIDKTGLIGVINSTIGTSRKLTCISRPRRFGKSYAAQMLCAYYDHSCDSRELFADLEIASDPSFEKHLNKYPVIYVDMSDFMGRFDASEIVGQIQQRLKQRVQEVYPEVQTTDADDLMDLLVKVADHTKQQFVFIIDEWDAICREYTGSSAMDEYVGWLRRMFKSVSANNVFAAVYMTGILPIKKYRTESALNNFVEYSMVKPGRLARYFGFTKDEVRALAAKYSMDFEELEKWYDGYQIGDQLSMFNPDSVMQAIFQHWCESYWGATGAFKTVTNYIQMNYQGLKDDVINMLAGGRCPVDPTGFQNDMSVISSKDDVLTVLIHLGYLSYDRYKRECYIPNLEVLSEMANAVKSSKWTYVIDALQASEQLLRSLLAGDADAVALGVEAAHDDSTSILSYNNENSLACVLSLAFYAARNDYHIHREYATGKGFANLVLIPRKNVTSPAVVIELKYGDTADTALSQIRQRNYPARIAEYAGDLLLVGISYDKQSKQHACRIERMCKD